MPSPTAGCSRKRNGTKQDAKDRKIQRKMRVILMRQQIIEKKLVLTMLLIMFGGSSQVMGQVQAAAISNSGLNFFASFGGLKTHVIDYTYNALGVNGGIFIQRSPRFGLEVRGGAYPLYARYSQAPVTAGYRTEFAGPRWHTWLFSGYLGGGMSLAQDAGPHYVPTPARWSPCWQASQGATINLGPWKWSPYQATWTETYTQRRTLSGYSLATGVAYSFKGFSPRP
jgi:hypothetical protein